MKKVKLVLMVVIVMAVMAGCTRTCKINGCKNEVYDDGLCQTHYYVNKGADAVGGAVDGLKKLFK